MPEQTMKWFVVPRRDDEGTGPDEDDSAPGQIGLPSALLQRHGALVLNPAEAAAVHGWQRPRSTVYRARTLLIPGDLLQEPGVIEAINAVLARVGMSLIPPGQAPNGPPTDTQGPDEPGAEAPGRGVLGRLPRAGVLVPAKAQDGTAPLPVVVDAWVALQALRSAATAQVHPALDEAAVRRIALEHLLVSSAINGSPISHGNGDNGGPSDGTGTSGPTSTDSYLFSGGDSRAPVAVCLPRPKRKSADKCGSAYGRRLVVAIPDTGLRAHDWLEVTADPPNGYLTDPDGFVAIDQGMQDVLYAWAKEAVAAGDQPRQLIAYPWDTPVTADPLIGELDTDTGHFTFIAGIVRQVAPDAQVLALKITHSDGVIYESDLIGALGLLAERVAAAVDGDLTGMVDVVSLSLGYFSESTADDLAFSSGLWQVIELLLSMGVAVVAAAGNYATRRKFYPAAFTQEPTPAGQVPLISVGALNPNDTTALFSDGGRWITALTKGAAVVSTMPMDINGSRNPEITTRAHSASRLADEREALDPDDYSSGFGVWSGTSFSAPLLAAHLARSLLEGAADQSSGLQLNVPGAEAATDRVVAALTNIGWQG